MQTANPNRPTNALVTALLTDLYQITMTYAHWKNNRHNEEAVFELFFRKHPFHGEFTIFCGLDEVLKHLSSFAFSAEDVAFLRSCPALAHCEPAFFDDYLSNLDCSKVQVYAMKQGSLAFPRVPLLTVCAPLGVGQLLETTLLTLINYPSLMTTNAARMVMAAEDQLLSRDRSEGLPEQCKKNPACLEFGLRRAQGPDGGFSASKYAYIGGFVGTSNVQAGKLLGIPIAGTHAHAFVQAYEGLEEVEGLTLVDKNTNTAVALLPLVQKYRNEILQDAAYSKTNDGELAAFIAYAAAFPATFLCLIDTYDTLKSGLLNFCMVSLVLNDLGYTPKGIRLDSGDLATLSMGCAMKFEELAQSMGRPFFRELNIVASNSINEENLLSLNKKGHAITTYGIGTNLVTCQAQPALGCVYKLVELKGQARLKLSQEPAKVLIPGRKLAYRLYGKQGRPIMDLLVGANETPPEVGKPILCRHPFEALNRTNVTPSAVTALHTLVFDHGSMTAALDEIEVSRKFVSEQLKRAPTGVLDLRDPIPYEVATSQQLYDFLHEMWQKKLPVKELS